MNIKQTIKGMIITFDDGFVAELTVYNRADGKGIILYCENIMGACGPGKALDEAILNVVSAINSIRNGEPPVWMQQEITRFTRVLKVVG